MLIFTSIVVDSFDRNCRVVKTVRDSTDLASICARRSCYRARTLLQQNNRLHFPAFLLQSLPQFAFDAIAAGFSKQDSAKMLADALTVSASAAAFRIAAGVQFNAWKPLPSTTLHVLQTGYTISDRVHVMNMLRSSRSRSTPNNNTAFSYSTSIAGDARPRTAASATSVSLHGFIASDDGGSSAFSDSSDVEAEAKSSSEHRRPSTSVRFSSVTPVHRRPHTSSAPGSDPGSDARTLKRFHEHTSSARALPTQALLHAFSRNRSNTSMLQVFHQ